MGMKTTAVFMLVKEGYAYQQVVLVTLVVCVKVLTKVFFLSVKVFNDMVHYIICD